MTDFNKKLDETSGRIRENVQQQKNTAEAERQVKRASSKVREDAINESYGIALRFKEKCIDPIMSQIRTKVTGGIGHEHMSKERGYVGQRLEFRETEFLSLNVHFGDQGVALSAEASCLGNGIVYSKKSKSLAVVQFDEKDAQEWIESHALEAFEAFGQYADIVKHPVSIVAYNRIVQE